MEDKNTAQSMTGYSQIDLSFGNVTGRLHLKSVNHRFTEIRCRLPRNWMALENQIRKKVIRLCGRGSFELWFESVHNLKEKEEDRRENQRFAALQDFYTQLSEALKQKTEGLELDQKQKLKLLTQFPHRWLAENDSDNETSSEIQKFSDAILSAVEALSSELIKVRIVEGRETLLELSRVAREIATAHLALSKNVPDLQKSLQEKFESRIEQLTQDWAAAHPSEERMASEALLLAEKKEVSEELQRIHSHLNVLEKLIAEPPEKLGKRLEFCAQELHREWTTLANKLQGQIHSKHCVDAKLALEKLREQCLNLA